ncbi:MAG TPA: OmpA family protein [Pseudaminobacter sp.]|nr:OmpA family protein [Pseudaminobacter sp.]
MKRHPKILAGTALGLLMACGPLAAMPLPAPSMAQDAVPLVLAEESRGAEVLKKRRAEKTREKAQKGEEEAESEKKSEQPSKRRVKREDESARERQAESEPAEEPRRKRRAEKEAAPADEPSPRRKREAAEKREPAEEATPRRKREAAEKREPAEEPAPRRKREAAGKPEPREEKPARRAEREEADRDESVARERRERREREVIVERQRQEEREPAQARRESDAEERIRERQARERRDEDEAEARSEDEAGEERRDRRRIFDSDKEQRQARREREPGPIEVLPLHRDDRSAQRETIVREIRPIDEAGVRVERRERRRERPEGVEILREMGDRLILQFGDQMMVESDDRRRLSRGAREVYTEELRNGRTRETILRPDGTRIVTIRNAYGDVLRRSRFTPDGYEQVLSYVDESDYDRVREWRDPGLDLPPIRIDIPEDEYILDASADYGADDYYAFLDQPPVEQVQRLYSVDEVKRSARVRDIARRVDLDTITFEFGSASIAESEIERLEGLANAMDRLLKENPAETFLIEGHTDAVGTNAANLALSDRRAEAVALALTDVFGLPPENLTTQGYGEEYLKIDTDEPERENRRVAVRRITALVAPVASAD